MTTDMDELVRRLLENIRDDASHVYSRYLPGVGDGWYEVVDYPGAAPSIRAFCDVIEIATTLDEPMPFNVSDAEVVNYLSSLQSSESGLAGSFEGCWYPEDSFPLCDFGQIYNTMCVGYALSALGRNLPHGVYEALEITVDQLRDVLRDMPWGVRTWEIGAWIDAYGTFLFWAPPARARDKIEALFGWLHTACSPHTGLWGSSASDELLLQAVNGFYRLTRGTYSQFGLCVPYPDRVLEAVLRHSTSKKYFGAVLGNACNVLDVTHPLWFLRERGVSEPVRTEEWCISQIRRILSGWSAGEGFSFNLHGGSGVDALPSLQGTEMWIAVLWLLCDLIDLPVARTFQPKGIHLPRPDPARLSALGVGSLD